MLFFWHIQLPRDSKLCTATELGATFMAKFPICKLMNVPEKCVFKSCLGLIIMCVYENAQRLI